jgi:PIN domain nuclease of toxin-antitoxin system
VNLLLDTQIAIWLAANSPKLPRAALDAMDRARALYLSAASIWEMALKSSKLRIDVARLAERFAEAGILALPVTWEHAVRSGEIAAAHPDPFDRLLLAQAMHEPMHLLTSDAALARYSDNVIEV